MYEHLKNNALKFSSSRFKRAILLAYCTSNPERRTNLLLEVFCLMAVQIKKRVNNTHLAYAANQKALGREVLVSRDDMATEAFLILHDCLPKLDINRAVTFKWYYYKSLSRALYNNYIRKDDMQPLPEFKPELLEHRDSVNVSHMRLELSRVGLTKLERSIIRSRVRNVSMKDFIEHVGISKNEYHAALASIQDKVQDIRQDYALHN